MSYVTKTKQSRKKFCSFILFKGPGLLINLPKIKLSHYQDFDWNVMFEKDIHRLISDQIALRK